jgi:hypothetical protein
MIVRDLGDRLELVTQPDHARAAASIMEQCVALDSHPRRAAILHAIEQHDNGWREVDEEPAVDRHSGRILDFVSIPVPSRQAIWPRGVSRLAADPWAAALVAHHAIVIYDRFRADPQWTAFFRRMADERDAMSRAAGRGHDELVADYAFLRLADLISLSFCTRATEPQQFAGWTISRADSEVRISPDVFGGATVPFEVHARTIRCGPFATDRELRDEISAGRAVRLCGTAAGTSPAR